MLTDDAKTVFDNNMIISIIQTIFCFIYIFNPLNRTKYACCGPVPVILGAVSAMISFAVIPIVVLSYNLSSFGDIDNSFIKVWILTFILN